MSQVCTGQVAMTDSTETATQSEPLAQPYRDALEHLDELLKRLDLSIQVEVGRLRRSQTSTNEWVRFAAITDEEVDELLTSGADLSGQAPAGADVVERRQAVGSLVEQRVAATVHAGVALPFVELARTFGLSGLELDFLLVCLAPEIDRRYERLYGYLQDDMTRKRPSIGLVLALSCPGGRARIEARSLFSSSAPLVRYRLLHVIEEPPGASPFLSRPVRVSDQIAAFLLGELATDATCQDFTTLMLPDRGSEIQVPAQEEVLSRVLALIEGAFRGDGARKKPVVHLHGRAGTGRKTFAKAVCRRLGLPLLHVDADPLAASGGAFDEAMFLVLREGLLRPAAVYVSGLERVLESEHATGRLKALSRAIEEMGIVTFLEGERPWEWPGFLDSHLFLSIGLQVPDYEEQLRLWRGVLAGVGEITEEQMSTLASKYRFAPKQIEHAVATARRVAALRGRGERLSIDDLYDGCRDQDGPPLRNLARRMPAKYGWEDLILPSDAMRQLREVSDRMIYCHRVYGQWGFDRKVSLGRGLNVLFSGPPGTGKTMAAEVLAKELSLDMYKIDLSQVVSKYIGETEKNLDRIFRAAEARHAILFFDEADTLFGKRSEVKDAHDRYANIEIGYLLQKMEEHAGCVILATNLRHNIDEAFLRRLNFVIDFPFPDEACRLRIWEGALPVQMPKGPDLDLPFLAGQLKLTGGHIKNIVLTAAFLAASEPSELKMAHLIRGAKREYQKLGWLCTKADFGSYHELLEETRG